MPFSSDDWNAAVPWEDYLGSVREKADVWQSAWRRATVTDADRARLEALPGPRRALVLTEDWCGDAARSVPVIVRAVEAAPGSEIRVLAMESHLALVDLHLSRGARAVPVVVVQDEKGGDLGWWGPRPAALQTLLRERLAELGPPAEEDRGSFYAPIMRWYRQDGGRTTLDEFLLLLERGGEVS
jgi:Thioredoxin